MIQAFTLFVAVLALVIACFSCYLHYLNKDIWAALFEKHPELY